MGSIAVFSRWTLPIMAVAAILLECTSGASALPRWKKNSEWTPPSSKLHPADDTWPLERPCSTQDCVVVRELLDRVNVIEQALRVPTMGVTQTIYPAWLKRELSVPYVRRELRRKVFADPRRFPAWCVRMQQFATSYTDPGAYREDYLFMRDLLNLAELIDRRGNRGCLSGMLGAFPVIDPKLIASAENICAGAQWQRASCRRIKVPTRLPSQPDAKHH